ncbi:isochorismatase family protein [Paraburkholderia sediminicola]|uniref:isochorismatase family protein n=1 Tax=Paraburkholderia sediminicola TaxID=458836 RepID=UPI0038BAC339
MNFIQGLRRLSAVSVGVAAIALASPAHAAGAVDAWVGTWAVAPQTTQGPINYAGKTLRQIMHTSVAGTSARIHLSNLLGDVPLSVTDVHIALRDNGSAIRPETDKRITFSGGSSATIKAGDSLVSDSVDFNVPALSDVLVSFYVSAPTNALTGHSFSNQNKYVASGDVAGQAFIQADESGDYEFLTNLDVQGPGLNGAVIAIGASVTDGYRSSDGQNKRWTNDLATRIVNAKLGVGVLNQGITGNGLLVEKGSGPSTVNRFDRDVLSQAGVRWVILSDSAWNDLETDSPVVTSADIIPAIQALIAKAHGKGVKFICSTLTPGKDGDGWTLAREAEREKINAFVRGGGSGCDGIVDQDTPLHDPSNPTKYLPAYDSGDHVHPNDAGYQVIANSVNLALLRLVPLDTIATPQGCSNINPEKIAWDNETVEELQALFRPGGNHLFEKALQTAFVGTDLPLELARKRVQVIVLTGIHLDWRIEGNARAARDNGYLPIVIGDATSTQKPEQARAVFERINNFFAPVISSQTFVELLNKMT